ncbi:MAG: hypothetical protein ACJ8EK_14530 [Bradyrhizobium sp.]
MMQDSSEKEMYSAMSKAPNQLKKFKQAARQLETDDNEKRFNEKLGRIAKAKPAKSTPKKKRAK